EDRAVYWFDVCYSAIASDSGAHFYGFRRVVTIPWPRVVGDDASNPVNCLQSCRFVIPRRRAFRRRNEHGELRGDAEFRRVGDGFARKNRTDEFAVFGGGYDDVCGDWCGVRSRFGGVLWASGRGGRA